MGKDTLQVQIQATKRERIQAEKLLQHADAGAPSIFAVAEMENARADHTQALKKPLAKRR
jgi:hypothetical protein